MNKHQEWKRRREEYNKNPRKCRGCLKPLIVKDSDKVRDLAEKVYCSRACANAHSNRIKPRYKALKTYVCETCSIEFNRHGTYEKRGRLCSACFDRQTFKYEAECMPIGLCANGIVHGHARSMVDTEKGCRLCGYNRHAHVCHIIPVSGVDQNLALCEVNCRANLVVLCPNHHWELDNGYLELLIDKRATEGS